MDIDQVTWYSENVLLTGANSSNDYFNLSFVNYNATTRIHF